jgi:lysine 2,3-aminomutase
MLQVVEAPARPKARLPRFAVSRATRAFRRAFFPEADDRSWNDWRWQLRHSLRGLDALERVLQLSDEERAALQRSRNSLPNAITPYYASLLDRADASHPLRRKMVMTSNEFERTPEESCVGSSGLKKR